MADLLQLQLQNSVSIMRKELQNLRKQVESLKYMLKSEITSIKGMLSSYSQAGKHQPACADAAPSFQLPPKTSERPPSLVSTLSKMAIGRVKTCFREKNGTPRQPGLCPSSSGSIQIEAFTNPGHSLEGLEDYSHAWLLFVFHHNEQERVKSKVKPPRLCGQKKGVFATRSPHRPCPLGLSLVRISGVVGSTVYISGVDLVDDTPILDIKPYIPMYDNPSPHLDSIHTSALSGVENCKSEINSLVRVPSWLESPPVAPLVVEFTDIAEHQLSLFKYNDKCSDTLCVQSRDNISTPDTQEVQDQDGNGGTDKISPHLQMFTSLLHARRAIVDVLQQDPRSIYRRNKCSQDTYKFSIDNLNITCEFEMTKAVVTDIQPKTQWTYQGKS